MNLSYEQYTKARDFIKEHARELEQRLFEYYFEDGSADSIYFVLSKFQNSDGGFGHGLEPDITMPFSSPFGTTIALQILHQLQTPYDHDLVKSSIQYLLNTYDEENQMWHAVSSKVNDFSHAPWWHYHKKEDGYSLGFSESIAWGNPTAEIIGYLLKYLELVPSEFVNELSALALKKVVSDELEMHEMLCYLRLAEHLSEFEQEIIINKLKKSIDPILGKSPKQWDQYSATPLTFVATPNSPLYDAIGKDLIDLNIAYEINKQGEDGSWSPNWSWGAYEDDWLKAEKAWKGILTLDRLKLLNKFNRIEGM